jgi:hypothetical protein
MTRAIILSSLTFIIAVIIETLYRVRRNQPRKLLKNLVWLGITFVSIITSFSFLFHTEQMVITDKMTITLAPAIAFPVVVFIKILIGFWVYHMIFCIANSERITETGLKIFGVEMTNKISLDIDQTTKSYETLAWQIDYADTLLTSFINYYITSFDYQVGAASNKADAIRNALRNILVLTYYEWFGEGECDIFVLPLNESSSLELDNELLSMIQLNDTGDANRLGVFANVGLSFHRFEDPDFDTVIIIRTPDDYLLPRAEISAASMFFISMVKSVEYMS